MNSSLPVNRLPPAQRLATGISPQGSVAVAQRQQPGGALPPEESGISLKVERYSRWALLSQAQTQLSHIQRSEQAIISSYRELLGISRQLERSGDKSEALAMRVSNLRKQLEQSRSLDGNLRVPEFPARVTYRLDRVDLLSPRSQSETLQIQMPDGGTVHLRLGSDQDENQNLRTLQRAFEKHEVAVQRASATQLLLRGTPDQLASPWVFRGQGVRVPAGNPVPIQLNREASELEKLEQGLGSGERKLQQRRLKELLAVLEQERRVLESQRQQLLQQIRQAQTATRQADVKAEHSEAFKELLVNGDFTLQLKALLTQANVSRSSVVALLGR